MKYWTLNYLLYKSRPEDVLWSKLSLTSALRGLEDEEWPEYNMQDLKERWVVGNRDRWRWCLSPRLT